MAIGISLTILPDTEEQALKAAETLARVAAGLALDGLSVSLSLHQYTPDKSS